MIHFENNSVQAWKPLARRVIAAASTRVEGAWAAYVDAVPGERHADEWEAVLERGQKLPEDIARAIFPGFAELPYAP